MADRQLREDILQELDFEPSVNATNIGVSVERGIVTLTGHVASYAEKLAAERAVQRLRGVKAIAEEIEVRYPSNKKTADDQIASRAVDILSWSALVPKNKIRIAVHDGSVTLSGEVDWQYERAAAENEVRRLTGVVGVINQITLKPRAQSSDIRRTIEEALKRRAEIEAQAVKVVVLDGGKVQLNGSVHSFAERDIVEDAVWATPGVRSVVDQLSIS